MKAKIYFLIFIIISILGYIFEFIFSLFEKIKKETLLIGPWMPIYGLGFLFVHFVSQKIKKTKLSKINKFLLLFFICFCFLLLFEQIGGILTFKLFHKDYWNYQKYPFSITKYVNLIFSFIFVLLAIIIDKYLFNFFNKIAFKTANFLVLIITLLFILDHIILIFKYFIK